MIIKKENVNMKFYEELFSGTFLNSVSTFTFNFKNDGRDGLGVMNIDELTEDSVAVSNSVETFTLQFSELKNEQMIINENVFTIVYCEKYPNQRFIPIKKQEQIKHLLELFKPDNNDELLKMFG
jgi:hypothetical protein